MKIDTANLRFREFMATDADYDLIIAVDKRAWEGEPVSKEGLQHDDATWNSDDLQVRQIIELEGQAVGYFQYSETPWAYEPNKYFVKIMVLPAYQGRGIGLAAYEYILKTLTERGATLLSATTREDQAAARHCLHKRGFQQVIREMESRLMVDTFERVKFEPELQQFAQSGIIIHSVRQLQTIDSDWLQKWWELRWQIIPDIPTSEAFTRETLAEFATALNSPHLDLNGAFIAIDTSTSQWVGMSSVHIYPEDDSLLYVGKTGVIRQYRRRGIALALKVHTIDFAKTYGAEVIIGENEENNPMFKLNEKLGFTSSHAWLGFEKRL